MIVKQILLISISEIVERVVRRIYTLMLGYKRLGIPHLIGFYLILSAWVKPRRKLDYYDDEDEEEELLDWVCILNWFLFSFISFISLIPNLSIEFVLSVLKQICPEMHAVRNQTKLVLLEHV